MLRSRSVAVPTFGRSKRFLKKAEPEFEIGGDLARRFNLRAGVESRVRVLKLDQQGVIHGPGVAQDRHQPRTVNLREGRVEVRLMALGALTQELQPGQVLVGAGGPLPEGGEQHIEVLISAS